MKKSVKLETVQYLAVEFSTVRGLKAAYKQLGAEVDVLEVWYAERDPYTKEWKSSEWKPFPPLPIGCRGELQKHVEINEEVGHRIFQVRTIAKVVEMVEIELDEDELNEE